MEQVSHLGRSACRALLGSALDWGPVRQTDHMGHRLAALWFSVNHTLRSLLAPRRGVFLCKWTARSIWVNEVLSFEIGNDFLFLLRPTLQCSVTSSILYLLRSREVSADLQKATCRCLEML